MCVREREGGDCSGAGVNENLLILIKMRFIYEVVVLKVLANVTLHLLFLPKRRSMASFLSVAEETHLNQDTFCQVIQINWGKSKSFTALWRVYMIYPRVRFRLWFIND